MYNSVPMEVQFFLLCVAAGFVSAFLYDLLRISRRIVKVNDIVVNAEDVIFFAAAAVILFYAAYLKNSGEIRWQWFIGAASGIVLYIAVVRNRLLNVSTVVIKFIVRIFSLVLKTVLFPVRVVFRIVRKPIRIIVWYTGQGVRRMKGAARYGKMKAKINVKNITAMLRKKSR